MIAHRAPTASAAEDGRAEADDRRIANAIADLVGAIGGVDFAERFFIAMRVLAGIELCSVFRRDPDAAVQLIFATGDPVSAPGFPMRASLEYARDYWRSDDQLARLVRSKRKGAIVVRKRATEIADPAYRAACYERAGVCERVSIVWRGPPTLVANGYRTAENPPFARADIARLELYSGVLIAAIDRHLGMGLRAGDTFDETELAQALMSLECGLSAREAEISAALILGETQGDIALRKQLSHGSVVTYRRRAYGKLGVANRRDLVRLHRGMATPASSALE